MLDPVSTPCTRGRAQRVQCLMSTGLGRPSPCTRFPSTGEGCLLRPPLTTKARNSGPQPSRCRLWCPLEAAHRSKQERPLSHHQHIDRSFSDGIPRVKPVLHTTEATQKLTRARLKAFGSFNLFDSHRAPFGPLTNHACVLALCPGSRRPRESRCGLLGRQQLGSPTGHASGSCFYSSRA